MSHPNSDQVPATSGSTPATENPNSSDNTAPLTNPDVIHQPKRRKNCPTALDKFDSVNSVANFGFSFSFDSKFSGCSTPEVTPKFGSFNRVKSVCSKDPKSEDIVLKEEEEKAKSDVVVEKNSLGLLIVD
ncbi:unnamed protein product [Withania somnifera]